MSIDDEALTRLRSLLAKATPGEWHAGPYGTIQRTNSDWSHGSCVAITCSKSGFYEGWQENTPLIAAAINALPALLDIAEAVARGLMGTVCRDSDGMGTIVMPDDDSLQVRQRVRIVTTGDGAL